MPRRLHKESLKRRREEHQLTLHQYAELRRNRCGGGSAEVGGTSPANARHITGSSSLQAAELPQPLQEKPPAFAAVTSAGGALPAWPQWRSAELSSVLPPTHKTGAASNELLLPLRPVRVEVVRGDTGRHTSFYIQPSFLYRWHHGNQVYESVEGEEAGLELQETVCCQVASQPPYHDRLGISASPSPDSTPLFSSIWAPTADANHLCNEEAAAAAAATASPTIASFSPGGYSYEATQVSRRLGPPSYPAAEQMEDVLASLGSCSAALFVDCLIKCVHDEAFLPDDHGWVYLYHGRHALTEIGRTRLLKDLFARAYFSPHDAESNALPALTVCVFRKY